ncbi:MAG TPA: aminotransferase class III-fold pyridoxal phosphate-dependent enzyme [Candidatus Baltobacteraceae bacterium]|nr:aminotransferase class III-fold pyridoxal phosphate-dependent enzyme [Candidatus Baltobacteraceae bacterium]
MLQVDSRLWLPFTQMQSFDARTRTFIGAEGTSLIDLQGRRIFDAVSSIWTTIHGHCHPHIVSAIAEQAAKLDHATTLGASNPVAEELAERLCAITAMDYAFFASDGASAIEAALKMVVQYWQYAGEPRRTRFVRFVDSYHGDTSGAMSLSDIPAFKSRFGAITFESVPYEDAGVLDQPDIAGVIVEPLVQAAAGMRIVPAERYAAFQSCTPLVIVDEIATGFGRTGTMFAFEQLGLRADVIALGKGITGGAMALSATLASKRIFDAFLGETGERKQFFHGHSYAGNPIACAAAIASLQLFESEHTLERARAIGERIEHHLRALRSHHAVIDARRAGTMTGVELRFDGRRVADALYERGHFTRAIGDTVQFVPPLSSKMHEIDAFFEALVSELHS